MKTCVFPLSRRNGFEWTSRSRSRWNGVRTEHGSSSRSRPLVSYERTARGDSVISSSERTRSANVSATRPALRTQRSRGSEAGRVAAVDDDARADEPGGPRGHEERHDVRDLVDAA